MTNINDFRDAVILWLLSDVALASGGAFIAYADNFPTAIRWAMYASAATLYTVAAGLFALSAVNVVRGWKSMRGDA